MHRTCMIRNFYIGGAEYSIEYNQTNKISHERRLEIVRFIEENIENYNNDNLQKRAVEEFHIPISLEFKEGRNVFTINQESA